MLFGDWVSPFKFGKWSKLDVAYTCTPALVYIFFELVALKCMNYLFDCLVVLHSIHKFHYSSLSQLHGAPLLNTCLFPASCTSFEQDPSSTSRTLFSKASISTPATLSATA